MFISGDYREILKERLAERCRTNPRYSLRAFARDLKLTPSALSEVLNGKHGLSAAKALQTARWLGLNATEQEIFVSSVDSQHGRSVQRRKAARVRLEQLRKEHDNVGRLTLDAFQVISDWYHYAILELTLIQDLRCTEDEIARELGLSAAQTKLALERLERLDLIERTGKNAWRATTAFTASPDGIPSDAIKKFHRQLLERAVAAISSQTVEERDFSAMIVAIDDRDLPKLKEKIKKFRRETAGELSRAENKNSVYCLTFNAYRLNASKKENR